jgi:ubiquitin-conjugating enzyme E2 F
MITLTKRLRGEAAGESAASQRVPSVASAAAASGRISVRDQLLVREVQEMEQTLPPSCKLRFDDPNALHSFVLTVTPEDGSSLWAGGRFHFAFHVGEDYNLSPPSVRCLTRLWHPNIGEEDGGVCLSLLRLNAVDAGLGWAPTRRLKDVVWGVAALFGELLNFDDPLNVEAAEHYVRDREGFKRKVKDYVVRFAKR